MPGDFDNVYLDTQVLAAQGWPRESSEMHIFLFLAQLLGVTVFLPEGVEIERRRQWPGEMKRLIKTLETNWKQLDGSCKVFAEMNFSVGSAAPLKIPLEHETTNSYDRLSGDLKQRWGIQTIPLATRDSTELFNLAVNKKAAFEEHGKGFQDTLIYLSVLDHLQTTSSGRGAFVSEDNIFYSENVRGLTPAGGAEIEPLQNLSAVIERLKERLADDPRRSWDMDVHTAERALEKLAPTLAHHVRYQLAYHGVQFAELHRWGYISAVEMIRVRNVQTPPLETRGFGQRVRISFDLSVRITVSPLGQAALNSQGARDFAERTLEGEVRAEADATWTESGYEQIEPLTIEIDAITEALRTLRSLSCIIRHAESSVRAEGYTELLGEIGLDLSGTIPGSGDLVHVDVQLNLDTFVSGRLNPDGHLDATLASNLRGILAKGRMRRWDNIIVFEKVLLGHGGSPIEEEWAISGVRVDATLFGMIHATYTRHIHGFVEMVSVDPDRPRATILREHITLEAVQPHMVVAVEPLEPTLLNHNGEDYRLHPFAASFQSHLPGAFKTSAKESGAGASPADHGTVFVVRLTAVPRGVHVFSTLHEVGPTTPRIAAAVSIDPAGLPQGLISDVATLDWRGEPMVEVAEASAAAWEIVNESERSEPTVISFGFCVVTPVNSVPFAIRVQGALGPNYPPSSAVRKASTRFPVPRFISLNAAVEVKCSPIASRIRDQQNGPLIDAASFRAFIESDGNVQKTDELISASLNSPLMELSADYIATHLKAASVLDFRTIEELNNGFQRDIPRTMQFAFAQFKALPPTPGMYRGVSIVYFLVLTAMERGGTDLIKEAYPIWKHPSDNATKTLGSVQEAFDSLNSQ